MSCIACNGSGAISVGCGSCGGRGVHTSSYEHGGSSGGWVNATSGCTRCGGSGKQEVHGPNIHGSYRPGSGRGSATCKTCKGSGKLVKDENMKKLEKDVSVLQKFRQDDIKKLKEKHAVESAKDRAVIDKLKKVVLVQSEQIATLKGKNNELADQIELQLENQRKMAMFMREASIKFKKMMEFFFKNGKMDANGKSHDQIKMEFLMQSCAKLGDDIEKFMITDS